jgi:hypothetical protein
VAPAPTDGMRTGYPVHASDLTEIGSEAGNGYPTVNGLMAERVNE